MRPEDESILLELLSRDDFIEKLIAQDSPEEVMYLFEENGVQLTKEEVIVISTILEKRLNSGELMDEELELVLGGQGIHMKKEKNSPWPKFIALISGAAIGGLAGGFGGNAVGNSLKGSDYAKGVGTGAGAVTGVAAGGAVGVAALSAGRKFIKWLEK